MTVPNEGHAPACFRLAQRNGRWSLIDPAGRPMLALGVNHIDAIHQPAAAEVFRHRFGGDAERAAEQIATHLTQLGFTNSGYGTPPSLQQRVPFFQHGYIGQTARWRYPNQFAYHDVFDPQHHADIDAMALAVTTRTKDNPSLIGYYWADLVMWDIDRARAQRCTDWVSFHRALPGPRAGKRAYVDFLRARHHTIDRLNSAYATTFPSFDFLLSSQLHGLPLDRSAVRADDDAFLGLIARTLYTAMATAFRKHDPHHLLLGDRYDAHNHPPQVLAAAVEHVDAIAVQWGAQIEVNEIDLAGRYDATHNFGFEATFDRAYFERLHAQTGKPILICDHNISFAAPGMPFTQWHQKQSPQDAAAAYRTFLHELIATPFMLGLQRCQYLSQDSVPGKLCKQGLLDRDGSPLEPYCTLIAEANRESMSLWRELSRVQE
jgi:hypothetical protein